MEAWREESRRKDTIIMNMTEAMKAIAPPAEEEPSGPQETPTAATEQPGRVGPQTPLERAHEAPERPPWWRRIFGA